MGRISGRQWGILMAASGENYMAAVSAEDQHEDPGDDGRCD
jgi:hypothetical protein